MKNKKSKSQPPKLSAENYIRQKSRNLPIKECYITGKWEESKMANILIIRQHAGGNVTCCMYMVDLACLGVKNSYYRFNIPYEDVEALLKQSKEDDIALIKVPYELVHNIIHAAIEYAEEYDFHPCKDFMTVTGYFLEEDTEAIPVMEITCGGKDGKPMYVNTGSDSPAREKQILAQLEKTAGKDNYYFILGHKGHNFNDDDDDFDEDEDDDDEDVEEKKEFNRVARELKKLSKEEQVKMFKELASSGFTKEGIEQTRQLLVLGHVLANDIAGEDEIDEQFEIFEKKFDVDFVEIDILPNSLFTDVQLEDEDQLIDLFENAIDAIDKGEKAKKEIAEFRKTVGDVPVSDFLELLYLRSQLTKKREKDYMAYQTKVDECFRKYPDYLLFKLYYCYELQSTKQTPDLKPFEELLVSEKKAVTMLEGDAFFYLYTHCLVANETTGLATLIAYLQYVNALDFMSDGSYDSISLFIQITLLRKVQEYLETHHN